MTALQNASSMNRVTDPIWLCASPSDLRARQLANNLGLSTLIHNAEIAVYSTLRATIDEQAAKAVLIAEGYEKYFENAYLSTALFGSSRLEVVQSYFDIVSSSYTDLTQEGINAACYEYLFKLAKLVKANFKNCLDFGCGPGTILDSSIGSSVRDVIGWDFSPNMRYLARNRGLSVMRQVDFWYGSHQFELVLSVFVLHYGTVSIELLQRISQHLKIGGLFAANFHKGIGLNSFLSTLNRVTSLTLATPVSSSSFGPIVMISRVA